MLKSIVIRKNKKIYSVFLKEVGFFRRGIGLMFRTSKTNNLLFRFRYPQRPAITSWFCFFDFFAVWLDEDYNVLEVNKVKPFILAFNPKKNASFLLEVPINHSNRGLISFLVGK